MVYSRYEQWKKLMLALVPLWPGCNAVRELPGPAVTRDPYGCGNEHLCQNVDTRTHAAPCIDSAARSYVGVARNLGKKKKNFDQAPKYSSIQPLGMVGGWHAVYSPYHFCTPSKTERERIGRIESRVGLERSLVMCALGVRSGALVGHLCPPNSIISCIAHNYCVLYCACSIVHFTIGPYTLYVHSEQAKRWRCST